MEIGFLLKKILSMFLMPLPIGFLIVIIGFIYLYINHIKKAKIFLTIGFIWIVLIANSGVSRLMIDPLNYSHNYLTTIPNDVKYILLLGGDIQNRGWEVLRLYHKIPNAKIITSGYQNEAIKSKNILIASGISKEDIIIHTTPKDTKEEAIIMKKFIGDKPFFLITAPHHMPRSIALFKKEGLNPIAAPSDLLTKSSISFLSVPHASSIHRIEIAWHEYLGLLWSKLRNQI